MGKMVFGIFDRDVSKKDRYNVTSPPKKFFQTKNEAWEYIDEMGRGNNRANTRPLSYATKELRKRGLL